MPFLWRWSSIFKFFFFYFLVVIIAFEKIVKIQKLKYFSTVNIWISSQEIFLSRKKTKNFGGTGIQSGIPRKLEFVRHGKKKLNN